jgi:ABC-2 type transport system ATP-binding protein
VSGDGAQSTIVVDSVSRWFAGVVAVSDVSLVVEPGVTALLGPNGAGKTTLLRAIAGLIATSQGTVRIFGEPVRGNPALYHRIGYMTEHESVYDFLTGRQFVELNARLQGVEDLREAVERAIETVDLVNEQDRRLQEYSRGMRQRMRLAATLVHDPPLLLLDEPLSGTDPAQRLHLQDVIRRFGSEGRTIVVSSHILKSRLADRIHLMVSGKLAAAAISEFGSSTIGRSSFHRLLRRTALAAGLLMEAVSRWNRPRGHLRRSAMLRRCTPLPAVAARLDIRLFRVEPLDDSLESVFEYLATGSAT